MDFLTIAFGVSLGLSVIVFLDPKKFEEYLFVRIFTFPNLILGVVLGFKLFFRWAGL